MFLCWGAQKAESFVRDDLKETAILTRLLWWGCEVHSKNQLLTKLTGFLMCFQMCLRRCSRLSHIWHISLLWSLWTCGAFGHSWLMQSRNGQSIILRVSVDYCLLVDNHICFRVPFSPSQSCYIIGMNSNGKYCIFESQYPVSMRRSLSPSDSVGLFCRHFGAPGQLCFAKHWTLLDL